jgi:tRNA(Ile2) C34 agmatinyltransferase TiaS
MSGKNPPVCTKCGERPAAPGQRWCSICKNENRSASITVQISQARASGFGEGIEAMRETLALEFALRVGNVEITGMEVAKVIRLAPRPQLRVS